MSTSQSPLPIVSAFRIRQLQRDYWISPEKSSWGYFPRVVCLPWHRLHYTRRAISWGSVFLGAFIYFIRRRKVFHVLFFYYQSGPRNDHESLRTQYWGLRENHGDPLMLLRCSWGCQSARSFSAPKAKKRRHHHKKIPFAVWAVGLQPSEYLLELPGLLELDPPMKYESRLPLANWAELETCRFLGIKFGCVSQSPISLQLSWLTSIKTTLRHIPESKHAAIGCCWESNIYMSFIPHSSFHTISETTNFSSELPALPLLPAYSSHNINHIQPPTLNPHTH